MCCVLCSVRNIIRITSLIEFFAYHKLSFIGYLSLHFLTPPFNIVGNSLLIFQRCKMSINLSCFPPLSSDAAKESTILSGSENVRCHRRRQMYVMWNLNSTFIYLFGISSTSKLWSSCAQLSSVWCKSSKILDKLTISIIDIILLQCGKICVVNEIIKELFDSIRKMSFHTFLF